MPDAEGAYRIILELVLANDGDILEQLAFREPTLFAPERMKLYAALRTDLQALLADYDFTRSPRFMAEVADKNAQVASMKRRFESDPVKRTKRREQFIEALKSLPRERVAYELLEC